jgi:hypothetical protein
MGVEDSSVYEHANNQDFAAEAIEQIEEQLGLGDSGTTFQQMMKRFTSEERKLFPEEAESPKARRLAQKYAHGFTTHIDGCIAASQPFPSPEEIGDDYHRYLERHANDHRYEPFTLTNLFGAIKRNLLWTKQMNRFHEAPYQNQHQIQVYRTALQALAPLVEPGAPPHRTSAR